jgi:tRNA nucleotidyltransferase/poly(A) polymerase
MKIKYEQQVAQLLQTIVNSAQNKVGILGSIINDTLGYRYLEQYLKGNLEQYAEKILLEQINSNPVSKSSDQPLDDDHLGDAVLLLLQELQIDDDGLSIKTPEYLYNLLDVFAHFKNYELFCGMIEKFAFEILLMEEFYKVIVIMNNFESHKTKFFNILIAQIQQHRISELAANISSIISSFEMMENDLNKYSEHNEDLIILKMKTVAIISNLYVLKVRSTKITEPVDEERSKILHYCNESRKYLKNKVFEMKINNDLGFYVIATYSAFCHSIRIEFGGNKISNSDNMKKAIEEMNDFLILLETAEQKMSLYLLKSSLSLFEAVYLETSKDEQGIDLYKAQGELSDMKQELITIPIEVSSVKNPLVKFLYSWDKFNIHLRLYRTNFILLNYKKRKQSFDISFSLLNELFQDFLRENGDIQAIFDLSHEFSKKPPLFSDIDGCMFVYNKLIFFGKFYVLFKKYIKTVTDEIHQIQTTISLDDIQQKTKLLKLKQQALAILRIAYQSTAKDYELSTEVSPERKCDLNKEIVNIDGELEEIKKILSELNEGKQHIIQQHSQVMDVQKSTDYYKSVFAKKLSEAESLATQHAQKQKAPQKQQVSQKQSALKQNKSNNKAQVVATTVASNTNPPKASEYKILQPAEKLWKQGKMLEAISNLEELSKKPDLSKQEIVYVFISLGDYYNASSKINLQDRPVTDILKKALNYYKKAKTTAESIKKSERNDSLKALMSFCDSYIEILNRELNINDQIYQSINEITNSESSVLISEQNSPATIAVSDSQLYRPPSDKVNQIVEAKNSESAVLSRSSSNVDSMAVLLANLKAKWSKPYVLPLPEGCQELCKLFKEKGLVINGSYLRNHLLDVDFSSNNHIDVSSSASLQDMKAILSKYRPTMLLNSVAIKIGKFNYQFRYSPHIPAYCLNDNFTINAFYYNTATGTIHALYNKAWEDIQSRILHPTWASEKKCRNNPMLILEALYLKACVPNLKLSSELETAINGQLNSLESIPANCKHMIWVKMFFNGNAANAFEVLRKYKMLQYFFPQFPSKLSNTQLFFYQLALMEFDALEPGYTFDKEILLLSIFLRESYLCYTGSNTTEFLDNAVVFKFEDKLQELLCITLGSIFPTAIYQPDFDDLPYIPVRQYLQNIDEMTAELEESIDVKTVELHKNIAKVTQELSKSVGEAKERLQKNIDEMNENLQNAYLSSNTVNIAKLINDFKCNENVDALNKALFSSKQLLISTHHIITILWYCYLIRFADFNNSLIANLLRCLVSRKNNFDERSCCIIIYTICNCDMKEKIEIDMLNYCWKQINFDTLSPEYYSLLSESWSNYIKKFPSGFMQIEQQLYNNFIALIPLLSADNIVMQFKFFHLGNPKRSTQSLHGCIANLRIKFTRSQLLELTSTVEEIRKQNNSVEHDFCKYLTDQFEAIQQQEGLQNSIPALAQINFHKTNAKPTEQVAKQTRFSLKYVT